MSTDDLIKTLDTNLVLCRSAASPQGYFGALWAGVMRGVESAAWEDPARGELLCQTLTGHYLKVYDTYSAGQEVSRCWRLAFDSTNVAELRAKLLILQHLLLGTSAMMNLSLPITLNELCTKPAEFHAMRADYDVLCQLVWGRLAACQVALGRLSPLLDTLGAIGAQDGSTILRFSTGTAQEMAWRIAGLLQGEEGHTLAIVDHYDRVIEALSRRIREPEGLDVPLSFIRRFERDADDEDAVAAVIDALVAA